MERLASVDSSELEGTGVTSAARLAIDNPVESVRQAVAAGRELYASLTGSLTCDHPMRFKEPHDIPERTALATLYSIGSSQTSWTTGHLPTLIAAMPHFLHAPLEALYLPAAELKVLQTTWVRRC